MTHFSRTETGAQRAAPPARASVSPASEWNWRSGNTRPRKTSARTTSMHRDCKKARRGDVQNNG
jgi:hypothetical protein